MFAGPVVDTMTAEGGLHDPFFAEFGLSRSEVEQIRPAPTTLAYTSNLPRVATLGDYAEALGAVLPCDWICQEEGKVLLAAGSPDPLYRQCIETGGGEEYAAVVEVVLTETGREGEELMPARRAAVWDCFVAASRYEWMWWTMGWTLEGWPG